MVGLSDVVIIYAALRVVFVLIVVFVLCVMLALSVVLRPTDGSRMSSVELRVSRARGV